MVACCGTESVIREVTWGGSLHKEHVVRDIRLDANKQASFSPPRMVLIPRVGSRVHPACRIGSRVHSECCFGTYERYHVIARACVKRCSVVTRF